MRKFKVIGPCAVAGVAPGDEVTEQTLIEWGAIIEPLIGPHLEEVKTKSAAAKADKEDGK